MNNSDVGINLLHFRVRLSSGEGAVGSLYKNGHHQCHVIVEVIKGIKNGQGAWRTVELTEQERDSVIITAFSNSPDAELPEGWSCDQQRNIFDLGLWERTERKELVESLSPNFIFDCKIEEINRYIRVEPDAPLTSVTLMARMTVEGAVYTTNFSGEGLSFQSSIIVESVAPYVLGVADLSEYRDDPALLEGGVYGVCYYWTPPAGLTFMYSGGLTRPVSFSTEGEFFQTSYVYAFNDQIGYKGGVVAGKDSIGLQLRLSDVHHGYHYPHNNPVFKYNERPTIMRAISLRDEMPALQEDSGSIWRLWDNYGNRHSFRLVPDGEYRMTLRDVVEIPSKVNIKTFKIFLTGEQDETNALYANGRHQCKVNIEILKEEEQPDGNWARVRLTDSERESITVTLYSGNEHAQLPAGWSCDKEKNMFDTGLWQRGVEAQLPDGGEISVVTDSSSEWFERYMRVDSGRPIESYSFMARVMIGDKIYTTYAFLDDNRVSITPVRPYALRARELDERRHEPYYNPGTYTDVDVYYWLPPSGLRFLQNKGLDTPIVIADEGLLFQTTYAQSKSPGFINAVKFGVIPSSNFDLSVRMSYIHRNMPDGGDPGIKYNQYNTIMRAVRLSGRVFSFGDGDARTAWRLWDNFGCEHVYYLYTENDGHGIKLGDVN